MKMILLIDNSESYQFLLQEELSEEGYKVIQANCIDEALLKAENLKPDLLILEMRQMDVDEKSLGKLKEQYPAIPLVGHSTLVKCPEEFQKWTNFYLSKSCDTDGIKELIKSL